MKKLILFLVLTFTAGGASAQSVQLSTYYPSPFGMYDRIRLVPRIALGEPCDPGTLYVENTGTTLRFCGAAGTWGPLGTGVWVQSSDNIFPADTASNPNLRVGIGTTTPRTRLELGNDGAILATGTFGSGWAEPNLGAGTRLLWYPQKAAFRMGGIDGTQWNDANIGNYSVAMGWNTIASDTGAVALGDTVTVNGVGTVALGKNITLPAASDYSLALGYEITSTSLGTGAIGAYLATTADGAAVIGSGISAAQKLTNNTVNSLAIGFNSTIPTLFIGPSSGAGTTGNVGVGTTTPRTRLELGNDGAILAAGTYGSGWTEPNLGAGTRLLWYPSKAAFRAGQAITDEWNNANIGTYSVAMGYNTKASNAYSTAMGVSTTASGIYSTAIGTQTTASGEGSTVMGRGTTASGIYSTAMGSNATAGGGYSTAMGFYASAGGDLSTAMGYYTTANAYASLVLGRFNVGGGTSNSWVNTDPIFIIGNGTNSGSLSNAMTVYKNGNTEITGRLSTLGGLVIETRTTNPGSPATGQMWLCTDPAPYCDGS